jgi:hypothetical protein
MVLHGPVAGVASVATATLLAIFFLISFFLA